MANKPRYTAQQVIDALKVTRGMVYLAAKQLQCDPETIMNYCKRHPTVEAVKVAARGEVLDEAELRLWKAITRDEGWAIAFALRTIGRHRGYVEKQEVSGTVQVTSQPEWLHLRTAIMTALAPYPEARLVLAGVLSGERSSGEDPRNGSVNGSGH